MRTEVAGLLSWGVVGATLAANLGLIVLDIAAPVTADAVVPGSSPAETVPRLA